jgi:hypothetical protein
MATPNEVDEIIELTEVVEEGTSENDINTQQTPNEHNFPREKAVENKDFDEELSNILGSVMDEEPETKKKSVRDDPEDEDLNFDDLFDEDISEDDILDELDPSKKSSPKSNPEQTDTTSEETKKTDDEFADLDNLIDELDKSPSPETKAKKPVEDEIISDLEKSVQEPVPEEQVKSQNKAPIKQDEKPEPLEEPEQEQNEEEVPIQEDKLTSLEQRLENLEAGLENKFAQIKDDILKEINELIKNQVKLQVTEILTSELKPLKQKIAQVEEQLNSLSIPDKDELKETISRDIIKTLDENREDSTKQEEVQKYVLKVIEQQLEAKISTWQKEKEALTREIEEASKYQVRLQDSLEKLASDIGEIKDRTSTEKLNQQVEELSLNFVSKDELKLLASQLKIELEEFIAKQVPLAAAQVIREEISALLGEKRKKETGKE